jgi:hypothetical protein
MIVALDCSPGAYHSGTGSVTSAKELANSYGIYAEEFQEWPYATPLYPIQAVPGWKPKKALASHIAEALVGENS